MVQIQPQPVPATTFRVGMMIEVAFFALNPDEEQRLRDLGIREGSSLQIVKNAETVVLRTEASRIALRREVAMNLFAVPVHDDAL